MSVDFSSLKKIAEGKTKIIYENPEDQKKQSLQTGLEGRYREKTGGKG